MGIIKIFTDTEIQTVWQKGQIIFNQDSMKIRKDACGATIWRNKYGDRNSSYGWEIDHINPISNGGSNNLINLQPLHWKNNAAKGDGLRLICEVGS